MMRLSIISVTYQTSLNVRVYKYSELLFDILIKSSQFGYQSYDDYLAPVIVLQVTL